MCTSGTVPQNMLSCSGDMTPLVSNTSDLHASLIEHNRVPGAAFRTLQERREGSRQTNEVLGSEPYGSEHGGLGFEVWGLRFRA